MIDPFLIVAGALALVLVPWFGLMALVTGGALIGRRGGAGYAAVPPAPGDGEPPRFLVVIPAHDEESVIEITVRSCLAIDYDRDRFQVCVIADNCTDATARVAAAAGAIVWERHDPERRSKGYALEDFFARVDADPAIRPPAAFVLIDADTSVGPDLLRAFARSLSRGDDFIQGYYTVRNADASWRTRLMTYAFALANGVWLAGLDRLGLGVGLKGNGMCFRAAALRRFPWRASGLVEDMEFAWHLRVGGERVRFQPEARVYGEMVSRGGPGAASQRRRWEAGRRGLRAAFRGAIGRSAHLTPLRKILYRVDLEYPTLGRLAVFLAGASACLMASWLSRSGGAMRLGFSSLVALEGACLVAYVASPVVVVGLSPRHLLDLLFVPGYLIWKVSVGLGKAPLRWVRTPRESAPDGP